jgi:predicted MFS family arabinose efflux permease
MTATRVRLRLPAIAAMVSAGFVPLNLLPFTVVAYGTALNLNASESGLLGTFELSGAVLGSLAAIPLVRRLSLSAVEISATSAAIVFEVLSCLSHSFSTMGSARACVGAACGMTLACGNALAASAEDPARYYMKVLALQSAITIFIWAGMPTLLMAAKQYGVFLGSAGVLLVLLAIMVLAGRRGTKLHRPVHAVGAQPAPRVLRSITVLCTLFAVFCCCVRDGIAWTLSDKIAIEIGLSDLSQTILFAAIGAIGLAGLLACARLDIWKRTVANVAIVLALASAMTTGLLFSRSALAFVAFALPWAAVQFLAVSLLTGVAAELDPSGRLSAAISAAFQCSYAVAPVLAGSVFVRFGYSAVGALSGLLGCLTIASGAWVAAQAARLRQLNVAQNDRMSSR